MTPNAQLHNPTPAYLRQLIKAAGLTQDDAAQRVGLTPRGLRNYLSETDAREAPYSVQFALEALAAAGAPLPELPEAPPVMSEWFTWRELTEADVLAQAPPGLDFEAARHAVVGKVAERFDQLPKFIRVGQVWRTHWPLEAIEPARFKLVMAVMAAQQEAGRMRIKDELSWCWKTLAAQAYPLHRLLWVKRLEVFLEEWFAANVMGGAEYGQHRMRLHRVEEQTRAALAEQALAHDPSLVPWAYAPLPESPVPELPNYVPGTDNSNYQQIKAAEAEWTAQHLERQAKVWLSNAKAARDRCGGQVVTAAALEAVMRNAVPPA